MHEDGDVSDVLTRICADKRELVAARKRETPPSALEARARNAAPPRGFHRARAERAAAGRFGLICEIKKASPSKGLIRADFDPPALARASSSWIETSRLRAATHRALSAQMRASVSFTGPPARW